MLSKRIECMQKSTTAGLDERHYIGEDLGRAPVRGRICLSPHNSCVREAASTESNPNLNALPLHKSLTRMQTFASDQDKYVQTVALGQ